MEILYIILGISVLLNIFLIFRGVKLVKQVEQQQAISANKVKTGLLSLESMLSEMQEMDIKGAFESDDEVGVVFEELKQLIETYKNNF